MPNPRQTDFAVDQWLEQIAQGSSLTPEKKTELLTVLKDEKIAANIRASAMMQSDYNRSKDQLRQDQEAAAAAARAQQAKLAQEFQDLSQWRATANEQVKATNDRYLALQQREAKLREAAMRAKQQGLTEADLGIEPTLLSPMSEPAPAQQTARTRTEPDPQYITKKELEDIGRAYSSYPVELLDLAETHAEIFGTRLKVGPLMEKARALNKNVVDVWREEYNPEGKIKEKSDAELAAKLAEAEARGEARGVQKAMRIPGQPPSGDYPHSPVFEVSDRERPLAPVASDPQSRNDYLGHAAESLMLRRNTTPQPAGA